MATNAGVGQDKARTSNFLQGPYMGAEAQTFAPVFPRPCSSLKVEQLLTCDAGIAGDSLACCAKSAPAHILTLTPETAPAGIHRRER